MLSKAEIESTLSIVREAGSIINSYSKKGDKNILYKNDSSPVTEADKAANNLICSFLKEHFSHIPIISEESKQAEYQERKKWETFWLVDPLDGTKEFIAGVPEYTVNLALIQKGVPVFGMVGIPTEESVYIGINGYGAFLDIPASKRKNIRVRAFNEDSPTFVVSRSNGVEEAADALKFFPKGEILKVGSSLKFIRIAEGVADIYFRRQGIYEWDTAAGHAVLLAAGGSVVDYKGLEILYGTESLKVKPFFAVGNKSFPWEKLNSLKPISSF